MSDFSDFMDEGLADMLGIVDLEDIVFRGEPIIGDVGNLSVNPMFDIGGENQRKSCTIVLQRSIAALIADAPRKTERITTTYGTLEIVGIQIDASAYTLTCAEIGGKK